MRLEGRDIFGIVLVSVLVTSMVVGGLSASHDDAFRYLLGNVGILPFLAGLGTLIMLFIGARHAEKTLQHAQRAERSSRFQKAAEMMASDNSATAIAAVALVIQIANEDRETYLDPGLHLIVEAIGNRDQPSKRAAMNAIRNKVAFENPEPGSDSFTAAAMSSLDEFKTNGLWAPGHQRVLQERLQIGDVYLGDRFFVDGDFDYIAIPKALFGRVGFERCTFRHSRVHILAFEYVEFVDCTFTKAEFSFRNFDGPLSGPGLIRFENCIVDDAVVNGETLMSDWLLQK